jgi:dihydroxyacetone kinase-like predicted kinase
VRVVPSRSQQAGLSAAFALNADRTAEENAAAMQEALDAVRTGGVAPAARRDPDGRFAIGDAVGYVGDELVAWGEPGATLETVLGQLGADAELVTCIEGQGAPLDGDAVAALAPAGVELELEDGGQPSWWWLLSAE